MGSIPEPFTPDPDPVQEHCLHLVIGIVSTPLGFMFLSRLLKMEANPPGRVLRKVLLF
jgi:hypothetical protein